jgi:glycosyltransferase involved in cell wall biosynthesis
MSPPLRVAIDATSLLDAHPTGVGVFTRELIGGLADRHDLDLRAFAVSWRGRGRLPGLLPAGVDVARRPMAARPLREVWGRIDRPPIEWWTGAIDVVHGPNFVVPPAARAAEVVTIHDLTFVRFPELSSSATLAYPTLVRRAIGRGAWIHTDSAFVADEVRATFAVDPERVVTVPLGAPAVGGAGDGARGRALAGAERYVAFIGTVEPRKDLPLLVRAFDAVAADDHDLHLALAGPDGWGAESLTAAIAGAAHRDRIVRLGWIDDGARGDLLAGATLLAYPSVYEGFGFPPLEAMAAGVPVVATDAGALPGTLGDAARTVPVGDAGALAGAIAAVAGDDALRAELIGRGRARVARFPWSATAEGLAALYGRAAAHRAVPAGRARG